MTGGLLHNDYERLPNLFRADAEVQKYLGWMMLAQLMPSVALVWIYSRGVSAHPHGTSISLPGGVRRFDGETTRVATAEPARATGTPPMMRAAASCQCH